MSVCANCGEEFLPAYRGQDYCTTDCRREAKKQRPPKRRPRRDPRFKDPRPTCRVCATAPAVHQHHVVLAQHVENAGADLWDERNALGVCELCHTRHHKARRRIRGSELRADNLEFARELFAEYAEDYLARYYDMKR